MNCPIDGSELRITERQGIEIDYCPQCRGIWLDRGELDKVLERSAQTAYPDERDRPAPAALRDERIGTVTTIAPTGVRNRAGKANAARFSKICSILSDPAPASSCGR